MLDIKWNPFIENIIASCSEDTSVSRNSGMEFPDPSVPPLIPRFCVSMGFVLGMLRDRRSKAIPNWPEFPPILGFWELLQRLIPVRSS